MKKLFSLLFAAVLAIGALAYSQNYQSKKSTAKVSTDNLLCISWQNAFCEMNQQKRECRNIDLTSYATSHFTLHGLWPQPRSKVSCKGETKVWLEKPLYQRLSQMMPGTQSGLHKHEWKKHGTCYGKSADKYFEDSLALLEQVNNSDVQTLFSRNAGNMLTKKEVMQAFDKSFGKGSGRKVRMICENGLITELRIHLEGEITPDISIATLMKNAQNVQGGCQRGKVDKAGISR